MKSKKIFIITLIVFCTSYVNVKTTKREHEEGDERYVKRLCNWKVPRLLSIWNNLITFFQRMFGENVDYSLSTLPDKQLINILSQFIVSSYDLSKPLNIIDVIKDLSKIKALNNRFNTLLNPQTIGTILKTAGANVNAFITDNPEEWYHNMTILHVAAEDGPVNAIQTLIAAGADVNAVDQDYYSALHVAAQVGRTDIISALALAGANVNARTKYGYTVLHVAAFWGKANADVIHALITAGADIYATIDDPESDLSQPLCGRTALHEAAREGRKNTIHILLNEIPDIEQRVKFVNVKTKQGITALYLAINTQYPNNKIIEALITAGAQITDDLLPHLEELGIMVPTNQIVY